MNYGTLVRRMNRRSILFLVKFMVVMLVLYVVVAIHPVNDHVIEPFSAALTWCASKVVVLIGEPATLEGTVIRTPSFAMDVRNGCNGVEGLILLVAGMVAYPASARARILGIAAGFLIVELVNVFRIAMLIWIGVHHRASFDFFHVAVWQTLIVLLSVALFVFWSRRFATPSPATAA
jgi:exosortase H (IPTLxxWG-CTERM-specific)